MTDYLRQLIPDRWKRPIKAVLGMPRTRLNQDWEILGGIGPLYRSHQVIDVGAHHGWFFHCWLDWCPEANVHAFEPYRGSFEVMKSLYGHDRRVRLNQAAVGSEPGEMALNILQGSKVSNSLLKPEQSVWERIEFDTGGITQEPVPLLTLDDYCSKQHIDSIFLLKIDVQGFETEVLKGSTSILGNTDYIFVEAGIERLYEGAPSFAEVFLLMEQRGFHLMAMRAWHRGNRRLVETDMLFRRNGLESDIDRSRSRHYVTLR